MPVLDPSSVNEESGFSMTTRCPVISARSGEQCVKDERHIGSHETDEMSIRDKFAMAALTGSICSTQALHDEVWIDKSRAGKYAKEAYIIADAMMAARVKE